MQTDQPKIRVETTPHADGRIEQHVTDLAGRVTQFILDSREAGVRAALIELGWQPPEAAAESLPVRLGSERDGSTGDIVLRATVYAPNRAVQAVERIVIQPHAGGLVAAVGQELEYMGRSLRKIAEGGAR